jgi:hypothetical protein
MSFHPNLSAGEAGETPTLEFFSARSNWLVEVLPTLKSAHAWHILGSAMKTGSARLS